MKSLNRRIIFSLLLVPLLFLISGWGQTANDFITKNFALQDVQGDKNDSWQKIHRAENMTVAQVVDKITSQQKPKEKSEIKEDQAVLVYENQIITVKKDDKTPQDTLIYLSSYQFVRDNTDSGFWQGYLTARLLGQLFDGLSQRGPPDTYTGGTYRGPWDYSGSTKDSSNQDLKKPTTLGKPSTSIGTGEVIRKSQDNSTKGTISEDNSYFNQIKSQKNSGFLSSSSKPRTTSGIGKVFRKSRR